MAANDDQITRTFESVCLGMLQGARGALYMNMRYLDLALSGLRYQITTQIRGIGTDGIYLFAHPKILADLYEADPIRVNRVYLHTVLHCLLRHIFKRRRRDGVLWRIACDIAVESIADSMQVRSVRMGVSRIRRNWYDLLHAQLKVLTAEGIYRVLAARRLTDFETAQLLEAFCIDDHSLWPAPDEGEDPSPQMQMLENNWKDISEKTQTEMETFAKEASQGAGDLLEMQQVENRERTDYKAFLRKFAVWHEQMSVDPDSFDYVFYTFGLSMYGNMPLIEPQEYREEKRIENFVIVIDVSMSTSGELVKTFLQQTYAVLTESESYLKKVHIHILQCDETVTADELVTDREELDAYMAHFTLQGGGGTDFRPAFRYVQELLDTKALRELKGMLYFTDGYGIYPKRRPAWETAFVFLQEDYCDAEVPPWAIKLIVEKETLEEDAQQMRTDFTFVGEEA